MSMQVTVDKAVPSDVIGRTDLTPSSFRSGKPFKGLNVTPLGGK